MTDYDGWIRLRCWGCGGHGLVADYGATGADFYGAKDCDVCDGLTGLFLHEESGVYALWPGGPLRGREHRYDRKRRLAAADGGDA